MSATAFPEQLIAARRWVAAKLESRDGRDTKVPYCAADPTRKASSTDATTWTDFATAVGAVADGLVPLLGFVLGNGFVGVDLDHCRDVVTGAIEPWAEEIVDRLNSYTEISVNGTGLHIICFGTLPPQGRRKGPIEMYDSGRFFVMTGNVLRPSPIEDRADALSALHAVVFGHRASRPTITGDTFGPMEGFSPEDNRGKEGITATDLQPLTDDQVLLRAAGAQNGEKFLALFRGDLSAYGGDHSSADLALVSILLFWTLGDRGQADRLFRQSNLVRPKWINRADYRERTFNKAGAL